MQQEKLIHHTLYYFLELLVLLLGFFLISLYPNWIIKFSLLGVVLLIYMLLGFVHHKIHHDLKAKIVIEYTLISIIILVGFVLVNSGRI